ncbi:MAG: sodium:solute symporter family protein [Firmicutes bacterium]|nr:sodium:solute symporter family protein [Bacillota bacterium]
MKGIELTIVIMYILACIAIGLWVQRKATSSKDDYWVAGRNIGVFANTWALMAALASGGSILGVTALGYRMGIPYVFSMYAGAVVGFPLAAILVARQLRNLGRYTITDFLSFRYDSIWVKVLVPIIIVLAMGTYIVAQMKAAGLAATFLLGIPYQQAVTITGLVFIIYVSLGGMWAVTATDIMQGILVFGMLILVALVAMFSFGGPMALLTKATTAQPKLGTLAAMPLSSYIGAFVVWAGAIPIIPHIVMRIYTAKNAKSAQYALNYAMILYSIMILIGVFGVSAAGHLVAPNLKDPDTLFLVLTNQYLPPLFAGLALAAVMAAVMSTTDALLLSTASAVAHDIYYKLINPKASDKTIVKVGMVSTWVLGLSATYFAFNPPKLLTMLYTAAVGLLVSGLLVPTILGIWWKRASTAGAVAGIALGALSYLYLLWFTKMPSLTQILVSLPLSLVATVVVSYLTPPPDEELLIQLEKLHSA